MYGKVNTFEVRFIKITIWKEVGVWSLLSYVKPMVYFCLIFWYLPGV